MAHSNLRPCEIQTSWLPSRCCETDRFVSIRAMIDWLEDVYPFMLLHISIYIDR